MATLAGHWSLRGFGNWVIVRQLGRPLITVGRKPWLRVEWLRTVDAGNTPIRQIKVWRVTGMACTYSLARNLAASGVG